MYFLFFVFVAFFFDGIAQVRNETKSLFNSTGSNANGIVDNIIWEYDKMLVRFPEKRNYLEEGGAFNIPDFTPKLYQNGYFFLKILKESLLTDNDILSYFTELYEYFNKVLRQELQELETNKQSISAIKNKIDKFISDLKVIQNPTPKNRLKRLYKEYNIAEENENVYILVEKLKRYIKENLNVLKHKIDFFDSFLLIKYMPQYFKEVIEKFGSRGTDTKPIFDKIKNLSDDLKKVNIDEYKNNELSQITTFEKNITDELNKADIYAKPFKTSIPAGTDDPLVNKGDIQNPSNRTDTPDNNNPIKTPSQIINEPETIKGKVGEMKKHLTNIEQLSENLTDKISTENKNTTQEVNGNNVGNKISISQYIESIKNNEKGLNEATKVLESALKQMQNEKKSMNELFNQIEQADSGIDRAAIAADLNAAENTIKEFSKHKEEVENYLQKMTGNGSNFLKKSSNEMKYTIKNIIAIAMVIVFTL